MNEQLKDFEIATGYFSMTQEYKKAGYVPISIARYTPNKISCGKWISPAPSKELLSDYKNGKVSFTEYDKIYMKELQAKDVGLYLELQELVTALKARGFHKMVLLCYEKNKSECHRSLFEHHMNRKFDLRIHEYGMDPDITFIQKENDRREQNNEPLITDSFTYLHNLYLAEYTSAQKNNTPFSLDFYAWMSQKGYELEQDTITDDLLDTPDLDAIEITI